MSESLQSSWQANAGKIRCKAGRLIEISKVKRSVFPGFMFSRRTFSSRICKHMVGSQPSRVSFNLPELLEIQRASFNQFVRHDIPDLFSQLAPIRVESDSMAVELLIDGKNFQLIAPDDTPQECISKLKTYSCKLYVQAKILCTTLEGKILYSTKDEWVLIGHLPLMTKRGHFIINGSSRVIVHQVVRSPGIYFQQVLDKDEKQKIRFYGDIIPRRGVWLRLQTTKKGKIEAKLKKGKKVSADMLQRCLQSLEKFSREYSSDPVSGLSFEEGLPDSSSKRLLAEGDQESVGVSLPILPVKSPSNRLGLGKIVPTVIRELSTPLRSRDECEEATISPDGILSSSSVSQIHSLEKSAVYKNIRVGGSTESGSTDIFDALADKSKRSDIEESDTFASAPEEKALLYTYNKLYRPAEDKEREEISKKRAYSSSNTLIDRRLKLKKCYKNLFSTFKDKGRYDLSILGREKINTKLGICVSENQLTALDIYAASNWLYRLTKGEKNIDDIDHFQNRRIRTSGELLQAQFENGVDRLRRLAWNKLKEFVRLQSVQRSGYNLQNPRKLGVEIEQTQQKTNKKSTVWVSLKPALQLRRLPTNTTESQVQVVTNGTKSDTRVKPLHAITKNNVPQLQAESSPRPTWKSPSSPKPAIVAPFLNGKKYYKGTPLGGHASSRFLSFGLSRGDASVRFPERGMGVGPKLYLKVLPSVMLDNSFQAPFPKEEKLYPSDQEVSSSVTPHLRFTYGLPAIYTVPNGLEVINTTPLENSFYPQYKNQKAGIYAPLKASTSSRNLGYAPSVVSLGKRKEKKLTQPPVPSGFTLRSTVRLKEARQTFGDHVLTFRYAGLVPPLLQQQLKKQGKVVCFPAWRRWVRWEEKEPLLQKREDATWTSKKPIFAKSLLSTESSRSNSSALYSSRASASFNLKVIPKVMPSANPIGSYPDKAHDGSASNSVSILQAKLATTSLKEFLSTKPLNGALRELFGTNPLSQYMDQTNPLAEITHKRRMSSLGIGGVSRESAGMAIRGIHPTHYGRICPIETPEGKNAGLVNSLALYARIDNRGFVETPYYKVVKGQVQHELGFTFFSAKEESTNHLNIAPSDLQQSWSNMLATDTVPVRVADNLLDLFKKIDSYQVDCIGISPVQMISVATSLIPFLEHNDANRALMASNMQRQAVPLMIPERAIVGTGLESLVVAESGHLVQSELTGFVSYASASKIVVDCLCCTNKNLPLSIPNRQKRLKTLTQKPEFPQTVPYRAWKYSADIKRLPKAGIHAPFRISDGSAILGEKASGAEGKSKVVIPKVTTFLPKGTTYRNLRGEAFSIHSTDNGYRRGQVCSCIRPIYVSSLSNILFDRTSVCKNTFSRTFKQVNLGKSFNYGETKLTNFQSTWSKTTSSKQKLAPYTHVVSNFDRSNQDTCLTQRALVREGDWIQKGDILTDCSASDKGELAVGKNILVAYIPWEGYNFEDAIVISERLVKEHVYTSLHIERYDFNAQNVKEGSEWFTNDLPGIPNKKIKHLDEFGLPKIGSFVKEGDILLGKIRYSNRKPTTPYERLLSDILGENNFSARDSSLYVPKGVHARVIKRKVLRSFNDPSRVKSKIGKSPKLVHIFLGEKRAIQVGDKMSGRHGNKGVVATILPRQDMPYLADGTTIDIILNPLGVPSRMNVGQVFEALLGLAGTYLAQQFKIMSFDELYGVEASQSLVYLKLYQARLQSGQSWLFQVDFPGKTRLIDGRSGECFDQWITVGKAYILKLIHMVNEKIHARATGPYALITQQPLRGRSQKGGQRLGEMEVWALEGFGAAYTLQELLTKKSDDMIGRKEVASAILPRPTSILDIIQPLNRTQENRFVLGQPEIFKVLICELQALCLDVGVYSLTTESLQRSFLSRVN